MYVRTPTYKKSIFVCIQISTQAWERNRTRTLALHHNLEDSEAGYTLHAVCNWTLFVPCYISNQAAELRCPTRTKHCSITEPQLRFQSCTLDFLEEDPLLYCSLKHKPLYSPTLTFNPWESCCLCWGIWQLLHQPINTSNHFQNVFNSIPSCRCTDIPWFTWILCIFTVD